MYSPSQLNKCHNFLRYCAKLTCVIVIVAPFFFLLAFNGSYPKNAWIDFFVDSLLIMGMTILPTVFLDPFCLLVGLYSREPMPDAAKIVIEEEANDLSVSGHAAVQPMDIAPYPEENSEDVSMM